jgi:UDP-N-acetylglucosamine 2-epimerase
VSLLLENDNVYKLMAQSLNPYGDGNAAVRIIQALQS